MQHRRSLLASREQHGFEVDVAEELVEDWAEVFLLFNPANVFGGVDGLARPHELTIEHGFNRALVRQLVYSQRYLTLHSTHRYSNKVPQIDPITKIHLFLRLGLEGL